MLALRWSFAGDLFAIALLGTLTLVTPHRRHHAVAPPVHEELIDVELVSLDQVVKVPACADAEMLYEHREFTLAASALRCAAPDDQGNEANAQLYDQLARAWDRAMAADATPVVRFESLRYARRVDLSLGGRFAAELDANLREAAPLAAAAYAAMRDQDGLELALTTCNALGVPVAQR